MEDVEINEYVRTKIGYIGKLVSIDKNNQAYYLDSYHCIHPINIIKHSFNLIDLIKIGDYVNNKLIVDKVYNIPSKKYLLITESGTSLFEEDIIDIVTKEIFDKEKYRRKINEKIKTN